jgi:hypothetical protein
MRNNHPRRPGSVRQWRFAGRSAMVLAVASAVALCVGAGIAAAQPGSARTQALTRAAAQAAGWPAAKSRRYLKGISGAFPANPLKKPAAPGPVAAPGVPSVVVPDARRPGISSLRQAPFGPEDFAVLNSYSALIKGRWYVAYAGTAHAGPGSSGEGAVRVLSADATQNTDITDLGTFPVAGTASLKVTAYSGDTITLVSNTGATFNFNLATLTYK